MLKVSHHSELKSTKPALNLQSMILMVQDIRENQKLDLKEGGNKVTQKVDMAYGFWILDYPTKKEKDVVNVDET